MVRYAVPDSSTSSEETTSSIAELFEEPKDGQIDDTSSEETTSSIEELFTVPEDAQIDDDTDDTSSTLSELSHSPTPPSDIYVPRTGPHVHFAPVVESDRDGADIVPALVAHDNIVDFYHVDADEPSAIDDGAEDRAYIGDEPPAVFDKYSDIRTLEEIIRQYRKPPGPPTSKAPEGLPEPMVWHVLQSMLRATKYLHTGQQVHPSKGEVPEDWMPIVHNDIRPANIIFTHPLSKSSKNLAFRYGSCKIGNFHRCVLLPSTAELGSDDPDEITPDIQEAIEERSEQFEHLYFTGEKTGFEAPEILCQYLELTQFPGPWSDLWSIGATLVKMMIGRNVWDLILEIEFVHHAQTNYRHGSIVERWRHVNWEDRYELLRKYVGTSAVANALPNLYSRPLRVLVEGLLAVNPWDRGEAQEILQDVEEKYDAWFEEGFRMYEKKAMFRLLDDDEERRVKQAIKKAEDYLASISD